MSACLWVRDTCGDFVKSHTIFTCLDPEFGGAGDIELEPRHRLLFQGGGPALWNALLARHDQDKPPCDTSQSAVEVVAGTGEDDTVDDDDQDYEDAFNGGRSSQSRKG
jgi:hypothetical protein